MNADTQQDHHILPVILPPADHFALGQQRNSIVTPPHTPPGCLHAHVDMVSTQYLSPGPHHTERLQVDPLRDSTSCSSGPSTAYTTPELDSYSAVSRVSSFNYPAAADPSLLTPVSGAGSPPLQQRQAAKTMRSYHHQAPGSMPGAQVPTPPNTSKLYYSSYDINASSQGSSPMPVHPQVTEAPHFDMGAYIAQSPPGGHHPSSPKAEVPPPIDPYLGHFTVSGGASESEVTHHPFPGYAPFPSVGVDHQDMFSRQQASHVPVSAAPMHHRMHSDGTTSSILAPTHPAPFRSDGTQRIEDFVGAYPSPLPQNRRVQPRKRPSPTRKPSRTPKAANGGSLDGAGFGEDEDGEQLTLRDDAPDDDKYLFQLRKEFISEKGKGMWEEMKAKYSEKHQGNWEKAALQMKVSRAVAKFGVWPKREIERLREAHQYYEEKRYQLILARMKENGGCRVWDWKPQHIEAMLVKLGVEEPTIDEKTGARQRRKNKAARRRASQMGPHASMMGGDWSNGLGLHHPSFQSHPHQVSSVAGHGRHHPFDMMGDEGAMPPAFTSEQENELIEQIFNKPVKTEGSLSPETMDMGYEEDGAGQSSSNDLSHHRSERVARQACEQMMQQHTRAQEHAY
ncbi:hypothetical protein QBC47DRAFT_383156 [Echria macrotheca]|uniref:Uncharacterized protein n=1 Tax=Echria macrotheca TaxID=438768 RepID=A0AAJ0BDF9_9PEZI|nr:hypothetical protein QBC47DRAFT_383156 [Echria macrotheca]